MDKSKAEITVLALFSLLTAGVGQAMILTSAPASPPSGRRVTTTRSMPMQSINTVKIGPPVTEGTGFAGPEFATTLGLALPPILEPLCESCAVPPGTAACSARLPRQ